MYGASPITDPGLRPSDLNFEQCAQRRQEGWPLVHLRDFIILPDTFVKVSFFQFLLFSQPFSQDNQKA